jgi:hypothetical protein
MFKACSPIEIYTSALFATTVLLNTPHIFDICDTHNMSNTPNMIVHE